MTVVTGLGVIFAISASMSLADAGVVFASITITPSLPTMIPVFPPAPPCVQYTPPFSSFTESGGGCCWAFARPANATATGAIATTRPILLDVMEVSFPPEFLGNNGAADFLVSQHSTSEVARNTICVPARSGLDAAGLFFSDLG